MTIDREAALKYASEFWNKVTDDDKFWTSNAPVSLSAKRKTLKAPASDGWEAFFVDDHNGGEKAVFRRTSNGQTEEKVIASWDELDDCTHYVCRCLLKEGIKLTETPRANDLAQAMLKSSKAKPLAVKVDREQGQKVIDSGVFKPGDLIAYYTDDKGRYTHTAMFIGRQTGRAGDPGGITCHTVCRFEGLTEAWNGADDDAWFLHEDKGFSYTLFHFADDDVLPAADTRDLVSGWWKAGDRYYLVSDDGRAFATAKKPAKPTDTLAKSNSSGYYFDAGQEIVFVWRKPAGQVQVERWRAPSGGQAVTAMIGADRADLSRVFEV